MHSAAVRGLRKGVVTSLGLKAHFPTAGCICILSSTTLALTATNLEDQKSGKALASDVSVGASGFPLGGTWA